MFERLRYRFRLASYRYSRFVQHFVATIRLISGISGVITLIMSVFCIAILAIFAGFDLKPSQALHLHAFLRAVQGVFIFNILFNLLFYYRQTIRQSRLLKWIVDIAVLLTLPPWIYPRPVHPWIPALDTLLYSNWFLCGVLGAYAIAEICFGLTRLTARRINPSMILGGSFLFFILLGSLVLMMPRCTYSGIDYSDSLFMSTSAVCITGLTTVDIAGTFTPLGLLVLGILAQIGGLGVLTFTSFFALFFSGTTSIYSQLMVKDLIYSKSMNTLLPTLLYILCFTLVVETAGAVMIYFTIPPEAGMTVDDKFIFSAFHSIMSFCNAGFSCVKGGMGNQAFMCGDQSIYIVTSVLVLAGAIGFPILVNIKDSFSDYLKRAAAWMLRQRRPDKPVHIYSLNTKLTVITTLTILLVCSVAFYLLESHNTLSGMSVYEKTVQSVFNSLTPRSAGFASVDPASFLPVTLLIVMIQMWIGGGSQSMAGGIKVNTFATMLLNLRAIVTGQSGAIAFRRCISTDSIRRANAVFALSVLSVFIYSVLLMLTEPELGTREAVFEVISAIFTVGTSLGATPMLGLWGKALLCSAMFLGRVGVISILLGFATSRRDTAMHYPKENVIIN
ncbi:MAG: potassium transporter [Muribaculaceae bacterium]|nr:potassium transporter [Muribaculaceae bacterium]